jgi:hypothetical protein
MELKKFLGVVVFGWGTWTGLSFVISKIFNTEFNTTYLVVGLVYIIVVMGALLILAKRG